jgi:hypothetical protein
MLENTFDLIIVAAAQNDEATSQTIWAYAERGGIVVSYAGVNDLAKRLGCVKSVSLAVGYAELPRTLGDVRPLRFLGAVPWVRQQQDTAQQNAWGTIAREPKGMPLGPALQQFRVGSGSIDRWSIDLPGTVVGLQQGTAPVFDDGVPAPDGSAAVDEGIWKADDRIELDWTHDRCQTEDGFPYFAHPYADLWRESIVAHILRRMALKGKLMPFIDYWPEGISKVAMISHDSDRNWDEDAFATLDILKECGIQSTWCMMKPGYSASIHPLIKEAGHELALHFNANVNEGGSWTEADFKRQAEWLHNTIEPAVTSNKNHFTRIEGWGELFEWCEACGIESDQTRGPSKKGNVGFPFGTCQPYFPIAWSNDRNRLYDVLEIGFLTQDIPQFTGCGVIVPFLDEVEKVRGVAHFLFHQGRIQRFAEVRDALRQVVREALDKGFTFWTGKQINDWERARRTVHIVGAEEDGSVIVKADDQAEKAAFWRPLRDDEQADPGDVVETRFGILCKRMRVIGDSLQSSITISQ